MLKITNFAISDVKEKRFFDEKPYFSFTLESDKPQNSLRKAVFSTEGWQTQVDEQKAVRYDGPLEPFSVYTVDLKAEDAFGETAEAQKSFCTGKVGLPWVGRWISDASYLFKGTGSPAVMTFRKAISVGKKLSRALLCVTAMGVYKAEINGSRIGADFFTPGFTTYKDSLQYQIYDVTADMTAETQLVFDVAGGWAVGDFTYGHKNRISADRQALLAEVRLEYADGTVETLGTDETWQVTTQGPYKYADFYDGETYDATATYEGWHAASFERPKTTPRAIVATYGEFVRLHERWTPVSVQQSPSGEWIYDFGQNFAGVVQLHVKKASKGQTVTVRHAEVLYKGELCRQLLRKAKCTLQYTCKEGEQTYLPTFTYMGFRYIGVSGISPEDVDVCAYALYSDVRQTGCFVCSDERLNKLQQNIVWSAKSNFVEIPTDCPQRDERMGWTGDIGLFAPTACFNFDMQVFLRKWLRDMRAEQKRTGGFPNSIPSQSHGFPLTMPDMAIDFWGDACVLVPWALYKASGDKAVLEENYSMMKKYNAACVKWAHLFSFGKRRYIWKSISMFHFGDWVAPDTEKMSEWQGRHPWTATASIANTSRILAEVAEILGKSEDKRQFLTTYRKTCEAYESVLTDGNGKIRKKEFQTAYVLPLCFGMFREETRPKAVNNLVRLVEQNGYCVGTGFPGTPYVLFALADNGRPDVAYKMLFNDQCPSWLYEVKAGGTTMWERWDALKADGTLNFAEEDGTGGMVSFNHYALGAVGDFLYRRVLGVEADEGGYKRFTVAPLTDCPLTFAKGETVTPYGTIAVEWKREKGMFTICVDVPFGTQCKLVMPDGTSKLFGSGKYTEQQAI